MESSTLALHIADKILSCLKALDNKQLGVFLSKWPLAPMATRAVAQGSLPVVSKLRDIPSTQDECFSAVVNVLKECSESFCWGQTYNASDFGQAFLDNYGWTEIIGQRGPIQSTEIACGFLLLGPHIEYPLHRHEAEEIYVPLSSGALWKLGDADWKENPRGVPIYHRTWVAHGMRTGASPLLALYIWHGGNLAQKSVIE